MENPVICQKSPMAVEVKKGEMYYWCACGKSSTQPFCNGSHQGTSFSPVTFTAQENETVFLCACKHTKSPPFCDGTHNSL